MPGTQDSRNPPQDSTLANNSPMPVPPNFKVRARHLSLSSVGIDDTCAICLEPFHDEPREIAVQLNYESCKHIFGKTCLEAHFRGNMSYSHTCPLCRAPMYTNKSDALEQMGCLPPNKFAEAGWGYKQKFGFDYELFALCRRMLDTVDETKRALHETTAEMEKAWEDIANLTLTGSAELKQATDGNEA